MNPNARSVSRDQAALAPLSQHLTNRLLERYTRIQTVPVVELSAIGLEGFVQLFPGVVAKGIGHAFDQPLLSNQPRQEPKVFGLPIVDQFVRHIMALPPSRCDEYAKCPQR